MKNWILMLCLEQDELVKITITWVDQIAECDAEGHLILFDSQEEVIEYRDRLEIDGEPYELPLYPKNKRTVQ